METGKKNEGQTPEELHKILLDLAKKVEELDKNQTLPKVSAKDLKFGLSDVKSIVDALKEKTDYEKFDGKKFVDVRDIDPEDYDNKGQIFFSYSVGYVIVDDVRNGHPVRTPFGNVIFFQYQASKRTRFGKYDEISTYCAYISHSKKEQAWLREHKYYGAKFFQNVHQAIQIDAYKASKIARAITWVDNLDQHALIKRCKENGVTIINDQRQLRLQLATKIVDKEIANEVVANKHKVIDGIENTPEMMSVKE